MIEQTLNLSNIFLYSEFNLGNIYSEVNFAGKMFAAIFICGNFFQVVDRWKIAKIRTRKNFVPYGI